MWRSSKDTEPSHGMKPCGENSGRYNGDNTSIKNPCAVKIAVHGDTGTEIHPTVVFGKQLNRLEPKKTQPAKVISALGSRCVSPHPNHTMTGKIDSTAFLHNDLLALFTIIRQKSFGVAVKMAWMLLPVNQFFKLYASEYAHDEKP